MASILQWRGPHRVTFKLYEVQGLRPSLVLVSRCALPNPSSLRR